MADKITYDAAQEIDRNWSDARFPSNGLRLVSDWVGGQGYVTTLRVPDNDDAPTYRWRSHDPETGEFCPAFYHLSGPTLAQWEQAQRFKAIDASNAAHFRSLAAESRDPVNVAVWNERADFFAARATGH